MGNTFHGFLMGRQDNDQVELLNKLNMQHQTLMLPSQLIDSDFKPQSVSSIEVKSQRITYLKVQKVSRHKIYDQQKQLMKLKSIVQLQTKDKLFEVASDDIVRKNNNLFIKQRENALELEEYIIKQPFQQKKEPYLIKLSQLPFKGYNMPVSWVYTGHWHQKYPHGIGKIYHSDFKYEGYVNKGIPHLKGRIITINQVYEGQIQMNMRSGFGRLLIKSGYFFEGNWKNNLREGDGYQIHKNGCVFQGQYKNNNVMKGIFYSPKSQIKKRLNSIQNYTYLSLIRSQFKSKYEGTFEDNKFSGKGVFIWADGRVYDGEWKDGKMNGYGIFTWPNGKKYVGEYSNNQKHGFGRFISEPKIYEGNWQKGKPHGKSKIIKGDKVQQKIWIDGKMINSNQLQEDILYELINDLQQEKIEDTSRIY